MIDGKKVLAIIPARGGSKRLPRKNILQLCGKPMIGWTLEAAKKSKYIDEVFLSTDCQEIANVTSSFNVSIPGLRPKKLALDDTKTEEVLLFTLETFCKDADIVILLQPTSPLRNEDHIDEALELFSIKKAETVVSVTPCEHSPLWSNVLPETLSMDNFIKNAKRSQEIEPYYRLNGAVYVIDAASLRKHKKIAYDNKAYAYVMENHHSIDIDTKLDFDIAEMLLNRVGS